MFMCSKAYCMIGDMFILPLCDILGIDESRTSKRTDRTWPGVKDFLEEKLKVMEKFVKEAQDGLAVEKLAVSCHQGGHGVCQEADGGGGVPQGGKQC